MSADQGHVHGSIGAHSVTLPARHRNCHLDNGPVTTACKQMRTCLSATQGSERHTFGSCSVIVLCTRSAAVLRLWHRPAVWRCCCCCCCSTLRARLRPVRERSIKASSTDRPGHAPVSSLRNPSNKACAPRCVLLTSNCELACLACQREAAFLKHIRDSVFDTMLHLRFAELLECKLAIAHHVPTWLARQRFGLAW